ncbi:MAG: hypothetical protein FWE13_03240 [Firmicutes bacterium]|nr:hypothetical protein [Bacillota bacterium]
MKKITKSILIIAIAFMMAFATLTAFGCFRPLPIEPPCAACLENPCICASLFDPNIVSHNAENGAWFLTSEGLESYLNWRYYDWLEQDWVQQMLGNMLHDEWTLNRFFDMSVAVIYDNFITIKVAEHELSSPPGPDFSLASFFEFFRDGNYYTGLTPHGGNLQVSFSKIDNLLNVRLANADLDWQGNPIRPLYLQYKRDYSITTSDGYMQSLEVAQNFAIGEGTLSWRGGEGVQQGCCHEGFPIVRIGYALSNNVEIKRAGESDFIHIAVASSRGSVTHQELDLSVGDNQIRVTMTGGPILIHNTITGNREIVMRASSPANTLTITVETEATKALVSPSNFRFEGNRWLYWDFYTIASGTNVYIRRPNSLNYEFLDNRGSWISIENMGLTVGENITKVVSLAPNNDIRLINGVLTTFTNSTPSRYTLTVDSVETIQLTEAYNFAPFGYGNWGLGWNIDSRVVSGYFGAGSPTCRVYIRRPNETEFSFSSTTATNVPRSISLSRLNLRTGANELRIVTMPPSPSLQNGLLRTYLQAVTYHTLNITENATQLTTPHNIELYSGSSISWQSNSNTSWYYICVQRPNREMVFATRTRSTSLTGGFWVNNLNLGRGENIVRIVATNSSVSLTTNGVFSFYRNSNPVYITLILDVDGNVSMRN